MKKNPIFLLTLIICSALSTLFSAKTQALYKDANDTSWWSVPELLEFSKVVAAEEEELCGGDFGCREELFFSRFESEDLKYQALEMLREGRFWITSINPTEETLEVLYFDEDQMLKRWGIEEIQPLEFIFIAWFDRINGQIGNYDHNLPIEPQFSDDLHLMYADSAESYGEDGFPANQPFKLPINNTNLIEDHVGRLYIATFGENYNSKGYLDYSSCLENYEEGETCQLMFSPGQGYRYLSPSKLMSEDDSKDVEIVQIAADIEDETKQNTNEEAEEEEIKAEITENTTSESPVYAIKAPHTGDITSLCEKVVEFPWWLGLLLVIGDITVMWFFWPKKSIKPLDKKREVR